MYSRWPCWCQLASQQSVLHAAIAAVAESSYPGQRSWKTTSCCLSPCQVLALFRTKFRIGRENFKGGSQSSAAGHYHSTLTASRWRQLQCAQFACVLQVALAQELQEAAAEAATPFLPQHAQQLAHHMRRFVLSGMTVEAHDAAIFGPEERQPGERQRQQQQQQQPALLVSTPSRPSQ